MKLKDCDIKVNDYKYQIALKKPWYISREKFTRCTRRFIQNLPNWKMQWMDNYLIVDLYFDKDGYEKDRRFDKVITNIWI